LNPSIPTDGGSEFISFAVAADAAADAAADDVAADATRQSSYKKMANSLVQRLKDIKI